MLNSLNSAKCQNYVVIRSNYAQVILHLLCNLQAEIIEVHKSNQTQADPYFAGKHSLIFYFFFRCPLPTKE